MFIPTYDKAIDLNMKPHTLEKIYQSLKEEKYKVALEPGIMANAKNAVEFMLKTRETVIQ